MALNPIPGYSVYRKLLQVIFHSVCLFLSSIPNSLYISWRVCIIVLEIYLLTPPPLNLHLIVCHNSSEMCGNVPFDVYCCRHNTFVVYKDHCHLRSLQLFVSFFAFVFNFVYNNNNIFTMNSCNF